MTFVTNLRCPVEDVEVVYTKDPVDAEAWLRNNVIDLSAKAVGFDIEWKPQFIKKQKGGVENKTAVLQLAVDNSCLVLHLHHMRTFPKSLLKVLQAPDVMKVGSGILQDAVKLKRDKDLCCKSRVDTQTMAQSCGIPPGDKVGLKALASRFLGSEYVKLYTKPKSVSMSNWEKYPLKPKQIEYAALDAWMGLKIFRQMQLILNDPEHMVEIPIEQSDLVVRPQMAVLPVKYCCFVCGKNIYGKQARRTRKICKDCQPVDVEQTPKPEAAFVCEACGKKCRTEEKLQDHIKNAGHVRCVNCRNLLQCYSQKHDKICKKITRFGCQ